MNNYRRWGRILDWRLVFAVALPGLFIAGCTSDVSMVEYRWEVSDSLRVPADMILIPGGTTHIGSETGLPAELPIIKREIEPFLLDKHPVTVSEFRAFVDATGYVTQAESFGDAGIFNAQDQAWELRAGANWREPMGPGGPVAQDDHPVTQISWNDAVAYAEWSEKRLPTEFEWEHAARGAIDDPEPYAWGTALADSAGFHANTWTGVFPANNTEQDGFLYTNPVGYFGETPLGLTDMGGNVWEWCDSWFRPYDTVELPFTPDAQSERVLRGGSFMCHESYCHGYRVSARSHSTPETSLFHMGFRTAKSIPGVRKVPIN